MSALRIAMLGLVCAGAMALGPPADAQVPQDSVRRAVNAWLDCDECIDGELSAVSALGDAAVPTLQSILYGGPSATALAERQRELNEAYDDLSAYAQRRGTTVPMARDQYVQTYLLNFRAGHQVRAAAALGGIPTDESRDALRGFQDSFAVRADVVDAVADARRRVGAL